MTHKPKIKYTNFLFKVLFVVLIVIVFQTSFSSVHASHTINADITDCSGYPEERIFLEAQSWWTPSPGTVGKNDFGHIHIGTCFPLEQTINGKVDFHLRLIVHNYPVGAKLLRIYPHIYGKQLQSDGITYKYYNKLTGLDNRKLDLSLHCENVTPCIIQREITMDTLVAPTDGRQEFRFLVMLMEPDGQELHVSTGWQVDLNNGAVGNNGVPRPKKDFRPFHYLEGRGWYTGADYVMSQLRSPFPFEAVSGVWKPKVRTVKGPKAILVTESSVLLDPAFHNPNPAKQTGTILLNSQGQIPTTEIEIDTTQLVNGMHRLIIKADSDCINGNCNDSANPESNDNDGQRVTGILVVPFMVHNEPADTVVLTPSQDTYVRRNNAIDFSEYTYLLIKATQSSFARKSFITYDLNGYGLSTPMIKKATLSLNIEYLQNGEGVTLRVGTIDSNWVANTVQWTADNDGLPAETSLISADPEIVLIKNGVNANLDNNRVIDIDVTEHVKAALNEQVLNNKISFQLYGKDNENNMIKISSRDKHNPIKWPTLTIESLE